MKNVEVYFGLILLALFSLLFSTTNLWKKQETIKETLPILQLDKYHHFLVCRGNGRVISEKLCIWCKVNSQEDAVNCFNNIGGTEK
jgi:hypothetical protein